MGLRLLFSLGMINVFKLAFLALPKAKKILKQDFWVLLPLLVYVDYLQLKKIKPKILFLHYQMTDLALANDNKKLITAFMSLSKKRMKKVKLGLMTNNLSLLDQKLSEWGLAVDCILAPFNSKGFAMRNSKEDCETLVRKREREYYSFSKVNFIGFSKENKYLSSLGIKKPFIYNLDETKS